MNDTEYHARIKRLPIGQVPKTRKPLMSEEEMRELLTGNVLIEEKLDGTLEAYPSHDRTRTVFWENLTIRHSIFYDKLPAFHIALDVASDHVHPPDERTSWGVTPPIIREYLSLAPERFMEQLPKFLIRRPAWATETNIEGIVVKNYPKQLFGKVVNMEFYKGIEQEGSYLKRRPAQHNRMAKQN